MKSKYYMSNTLHTTFRVLRDDSAKCEGENVWVGINHVLGGRIANAVVGPLQVGRMAR